MAQHTSAMKRIRRDAKQTVRNHSRLSRIRTFIKKVETALAGKDKVAAQAALKLAQPEIMRGVTKGVLHHNTAARKISRLNVRVKAVS
jgi:small subunit ribosomal protein S20